MRPGSDQADTSHIIPAVVAASVSWLSLHTSAFTSCFCQRRWGDLAHRPEKSQHDAVR